LEVTICDLHRLNQNLLHFIERNLILAPVVKLRRPGRLMVGDVLRGFERALVLQVGGDACCAEGVVSDPGLDAGVGRAALNYPGLGARNLALPPAATPAAGVPC
jgi:hypothetical protein